MSKGKIQFNFSVGNLISFVVSGIIIKKVLARPLTVGKGAFGQVLYSYDCCWHFVDSRTMAERTLGYPAHTKLNKQ